MTNQGVSVTIINHVATDIAASPATVWNAILDEYVRAEKFRRSGYTIEPLDDPASFLGGFRLRLEKDGVLVEDRLYRITEYDETARRLSLYADRSAEISDGIVIYAIYQALPGPLGARYAIDCHARMTIPMPADGDVASAVAEIRSSSEAALGVYLSSIKSKLDSPSIF